MTRSDSPQSGLANLQCFPANCPLRLINHVIVKSIGAPVYAQLFGTILLCSDCVIAGGSSALGTSVPTSIEHVQFLHQPPTGPYNAIEFVFLDRAVAGKEGVVERKFRALTALRGANAVNFGNLKKLRYLGPWFSNVRRAMKDAIKE